MEDNEDKKTGNVFSNVSNVINKLFTPAKFKIGDSVQESSARAPYIPMQIVAKCRWDAKEKCWMYTLEGDDATEMGEYRLMKDPYDR